VARRSESGAGGGSAFETCLCDHAISPGSLGQIQRAVTALQQLSHRLPWSKLRDADRYRDARQNIAGGAAGDLTFGNRSTDAFGDVVMGSFSKTFGSNGGFVACKSRAAKEYLRYYSAPATFSNALSPVQAATVLKAFDIVESIEGRVLRLALMANILSLRHQLREAGLDYYGDPSAIVCVKMGTEGLARLVSKRLPEMGLIANLVEFPAVPKGAARIRMQVMANHSVQNIADAVEILKTARQQAEVQFDDINRPSEPPQQAVA
jgi:hypothetical protein